NDLNPNDGAQTLRRISRAAIAATFVGSLAVVALPGAAHADVVSSTFNTPGYHAGSVPIPATICFVTVTASGGSGGTATDGGAGGAAATVSGRVGVTPGVALDVLVGGGGGNGVAGSSSSGGAGGIGGGGGGGRLDTDIKSGGGGGGGASA